VKGPCVINYIKRETGKFKRYKNILFKEPLISFSMKYSMFSIWGSLEGIPAKKKQFIK
jgi:hypothetical protein